MILVTTGTNEQPFDRLVQAAATLDAAEPMFVQYGASKVAHGPGEWVDFLSFDELAERMTAARVVVCHAGVGSIMLARRCGKRPIVLPRRVHLSEAVDDHQLPLARRLDASGIVHLVEDERDLGRAIVEIDGRAAAARVTEHLPNREALTTDLRGYLATLMGGSAAPVATALGELPAEAVN
jgi:UDP-N-acetylglucosamine transferase subunit ALG13